jgi:hypothetical protein
MPTNILINIFDQTNIGSFWECFSDPLDGDELFSAILIKFDRFFIGYIEGVSEKLRADIIEIFKEISVRMLEYVSKDLKGREKETL